MLLPLSVYAQKTPEQYIEEFAEMAVAEMKRLGVPASITLAQGILESGSGNSRLAKEGNNHFGIKCHAWKGAKIYADDDAKNECFRKYKSAAESFKDHSDFLRNNSRYHFLFELEITNYKEWAKGLKKAGYATSPTYAEALIKLIERYNLDNYDIGIVPDKKPRKTPKTQVIVDNFNLNPYGRDVFYINNAPYIVATESDDIQTICNEFDMRPWQIRRYNDLSKTDSISEGNFIYLKPKRNRAERGKNTHRVAQGETMKDISDMYGVKLNKLYRKNKMNPNSEPKAGDVINLRKTKR
ncbi:MAG: LysM peptidoglycan-binding domain-containing protein [Bacteroidales bacterium]|nr:LysM peptidoglycan-binding domain-containing protein [Bacteroidales bacterium]